MYQMSQGGCNYQSSSSGLERIANSGANYTPNPVAYSITSPIRYLAISLKSILSISKKFNYDTPISKAYSHNNPVYEIFNTEPEYNFQPDHFLKPNQGTKFVGKTEQVREFVEETFEKMLNQPVPSDIKISILDKKDFKKIAPNSSTIGLSINRSKAGLLSEIFILNDTIGRVMLTIGHELGHVLTQTLNNQHDEEAKAYAFSIAWMETIKEHNIAGLGNAIILENPALNGLHDISFAFVAKMIKSGKKVWEVYKGLIERNISIAS